MARSGGVSGEELGGLFEKARNFATAHGEVRVPENRGHIDGVPISSDPTEHVVDLPVDRLQEVSPAASQALRALGVHSMLTVVARDPHYFPDSFMGAPDQRPEPPGLYIAYDRRLGRTGYTAELRYFIERASDGAEAYTVITDHAIIGQALSADQRAVLESAPLEDTKRLDKAQELLGGVGRLTTARCAQLGIIVTAGIENWEAISAPPPAESPPA